MTGSGTLAIILGAQAWPDMPTLRSSNAFALSATAFKSYLQDSAGLDLPESCIKDLFDSELPRDQIDLELRRFLQSHHVGDAQLQQSNHLLYWSRRLHAW
jgi:hypothetical protein